MAITRFETQDGIIIRPDDDIVNQNDQTLLGGSGGGGIFETSYTYQQGTWLDNYQSAADGHFATQNDEDSSSDLVQSTKYLLLGKDDANGKDNSVVFNWLTDAGVGAQIRVTDPQGNQVARLATVNTMYPDSTYNTYNGYQIHVTRMFGNNTPNKTKIMITPTYQNGFDADYTAETDWSRWYINGKTDPIVLSLYGENDELPLDITQVWNFATSVVDTFSGLATATERRTAFYAQIDTLIANAFPPGTLYQDFEFFNNGYYEIYDGVDNRLTINTASGTGAYFHISWDKTHYWISREGRRYFDAGTNYQVNDTFVMLGSYFGGIDGTNDLTITVTEVDSQGGIKRVSVTGTQPSTVTWPTNSVIGGGSYQEYNGNKFFTNYTGNNANQGHNQAAASGETLQAVPYNDGVVSSTEGLFTATGALAGEYVVAYKSSVLALFVTGNTAGYIETDGDSGSNSGNLDVAYQPNWVSYGVQTRIVEGGGSWVPGTKYKFTFDFNTATGRIKFNGNNIFSEPSQSIWVGTFGGEGAVYIPNDSSLGYNQVQIYNGGYSNPQNNIYNNGGVRIDIGNGNWTFRQDIQNTDNPAGSDYLYVANPNNTREVSPWSVQCNANVDTVVYTATANYVASIKLFLQAEGSPDTAGSPWSNNWEAQATDAIVITTTNNGAPNYASPAITVYGRVYTGDAPVATFSVRKNTTSGRIEVLARPTSTTYQCWVRATATEIISTD